MSYMGPGMGQNPYGPLVGPPLATPQQIAAYREAKKKNTCLTIALVIIVLLLIAAIIAVFTIAFQPKAPTSTIPTTPKTVTIQFKVTFTSVNYNPAEHGTGGTKVTEQSNNICREIINQVSPTFATSNCKAISFTAVPNSAQGIYGTMSIDVETGTKSNSQVVVDFGAKLYAIPVATTSMTVEQGSVRQA